MRYFKLLVIPTVLLSIDPLLAESCPTLDTSQFLQIMHDQTAGVKGEWKIRSKNIELNSAISAVSPPISTNAKEMYPPGSYHQGETPSKVYLCEYNVTTAPTSNAAGQTIKVTIGKISVFAPPTKG